MNAIKQLFLKQCEKLIEKIMNDQPTAYSTFNFACRSLACGYKWSRFTLDKCHEKIMGRVSHYCDAYRFQKKLDKRRKTLGNNLILYVYLFMIF